MSFLGWYDPDKHRAPAAKLTDAIDRYRAKFGHDPTAAMCSVHDAAALTNPPIPVEGVAFIPRSTFYVGHHDPIPPEQDQP